jgi:hypothetical protein
MAWPSTSELVRRAEPARLNFCSPNSPPPSESLPRRQAAQRPRLGANMFPHAPDCRNAVCELAANLVGLGAAGESLCSDRPPRVLSFHASPGRRIRAPYGSRRRACPFECAHRPPAPDASIREHDRRRSAWQQHRRGEKDGAGGDSTRGVLKLNGSAGSLRGDPQPKKLAGDVGRGARGSLPRRRRGLPSP